MTALGSSIRPLVKPGILNKLIALDLYFLAPFKRLLVKKNQFPSRNLRAGAFVNQKEGFRAFIPKTLPPDPPLETSEETQSLLAQAERNLGRLDGLSVLVPDPDRFVYMYVRQEAVLSSQIEGTQASLADLLAFEASDNKETEKASDVGEIVNYVAALKRGIALLDSLPISARLLKEVHATLMKGTRGGETSRTPGEFRRSQNWIGGKSPVDAVFVPPPVPEMHAAIADFEKYSNARKSVPLMVEVALAHAQFETIHPFLDGNGRIGRLLITFLLLARKAMSKPLLYLSVYFKLNREEYYARLQAVRTEGDWEGWVRFFLTGVAEVADEATQRARKIIELRQTHHRLIREKLKRRTGSALDLLDLMIERPVVTSRWVQQKLQRTQPTIDLLLSDLVKIGLLRETTGQKWGRRFSYGEYLKLFNG